MKTSLRSWCLGSCLLIALTVGTFVSAQDKKTDAVKATEKKADAPKKATSRLPDYFNKLELSDDQKTKIHAVQATYGAQIADLKAKLKALDEKQDTEVEAVLTPDQLKSLTELRATAAAAAKKKADDKKAADKAKAEAEKKPAAAAAEPAKKTEEKKPEATKK
ncbi:MAG: hypothetical protein JWM11_3794 [Planctomycetaceae bacterium]|nr:hypothetical protein [Planctomycetaceae bacterium]